MTARGTTIALALALAAACDEGPPEPPASPPRPPEPPATDELVLPEPEAPSPAWPADVESLAASLREFTDQEACRRGVRQQMSTVVAEAIHDIGYENFVDDVCASLAAVEAGDEAACDALGVSTLERGCRRRLALVHGRPGACPDDRTLPGREPLCLAWATRDPGLCRAAPTKEQPLCRATLDGEPDACREAAPRTRPRCRALVRRYADALGDERSESPAMEIDTAFVVEIASDGGEPRRIESEGLDRGVYLRAEGCGRRVELGGPLAGRHGGLTLGLDDDAATARFVVPAGVETPVTLELGPAMGSLEVVVPREGRYDSSQRQEGTITVEALEPHHGGRLRGRFEATLGGRSNERHVEGSFRTFIRDVDPLPARCTPGGRVQNRSRP